MATTVPGMIVWKRRAQNLCNGYMNILSRRYNLIGMSATLNSPKMKPPNILVYSSVKEHSCKERTSTSILEKCLMKHRYIVYPLMHDKMMMDPWMENCTLLVLPNFISVDDSIVNLLKNFVTDGGKVLSFCCSVAEQFGINSTPLNDEPSSCYNMIAGDKIVPYDILEADNKSFIIDNSSNCDPILECVVPNTDIRKVIALKQCWTGDGCMIHCSLPFLKPRDETECLITNDSSHEIVRYLLSIMGLQTDNPTSSNDNPSPAYVYCSDTKLLFQFIKDTKLAALGSMIKGDSLTLEFSEHSKRNPDGIIQSMNHIPVLYSANIEDFKLYCKFNWNQYRQTLISKKFGKLVVYSDKVTSTMDMAETLISRLYDAKDFCVTCIARQQTKGKGRGGNKWISPPGTAMMTMSFSLPLRSYLGERLPILQHIMTIAVVHAIRSIPAFKDLDLRVKWPNDIYFGSTIKIGGVLVRSTMFRNTCVATVGCGVNVDNPHPTQCINKLIHSMGVNVSLSCEEVLALSISEFDRLVQEFQQNGPKAFINLYHKYWIHSKQRVKVQVNNHYIDAEVIGIDEFGFLCVMDFQSGPSPKIITLQPNGNSFDMMKNMIAMK